jgi:hypothetical protein
MTSLAFTDGCTLTYKRPPSYPYYSRMYPLLMRSYATIIVTYLNEISLEEKVSPIYSSPSSLSRTQPNTTLYILLQNAATVFAYWHLSAGKIALIEEHYSTHWEELRPTLRLYDITGLSFDGTRAYAVRQLPVQEQSCCYIEGVKQGRTFAADLGIWNQDEQFIPLIRSNEITTPCMESLDVSISSVDNYDSTFNQLLEAPMPPYGYDQFSAYTVYSPIPLLTKKMETATGGNRT